MPKGPNPNRLKRDEEVRQMHRDLKAVKEDGIQKYSEDHIMNKIAKVKNISVRTVEKIIWQWDAYKTNE